MIDLIALTQATVETFQSIAPLVAELAGGQASMIAGYIDSNPDLNSVGAEIYEMAPGSILVAWQETLLNDSSSDMSMWVHRFQYFLRADRGKSTLDLIRLLVNGIPVPGDGRPWRMCPVMDGVLPAQLSNIARVVDGEGIDYFAITAEIPETGDA